MTDIAIDIAIILCAAVALVLAILRIWEQNRLKKATTRLVRSHAEFDRVLDKVSDYIGIDDDKSSEPTISHRFWYHPHVNLRDTQYVTCRVHRRPQTIVLSVDERWTRTAFDRIATEQLTREVNPEASWIFEDESAYIPALR